MCIDQESAKASPVTNDYINIAAESVENLQGTECYIETNLDIHEVSNVKHTMQNDVPNPNSVCQYPMIPIQSDNHIVNDGEDLLYATPIPYNHESVKPDLVERHSHADVVVQPGRYDNVCTGNVIGQSLSDVPELLFACPVCHLI